MNGLYLVLVAIALATSLPANLGHAENNSELQQSLISLHQGLERIRTELYGNCFLEGVYKTDNSASGERFRFWSRENRYFRVDILDSTAEVVKRVICRPEGYVVLARNNQALTVVDYGTDESGKEKLFAFPFFLESTRAAGLGPEIYFVNDVSIDGFPPRNESINSQTQLNEQPNGHLEFINTATNELGESVSRIEFTSKAAPCILSYDLMVKLEGKLHSRRTGAFSYDHSPAVDTFPKTSHYTSLNSSGEKIVSHCEILSVDPTAQPVGLFSLDAQGISQGSVWLRRMTMLVAGLAILGCLFLCRKLKKHA